MNNPSFHASLTPEAKDRLNRSSTKIVIHDAESSADVWDRLEELGITEDDVRTIRVMGLSEQDRHINETILRLEKDVNEIILGVGEDTKAVDIYIVVAVQRGGLVQFQVSNGPPGFRDTSYDCYAYSEAKAVFDCCCEEGFYQWKRAGN